MPKKWTVIHLSKVWKILPWWRNFAKFGHTEEDSPSCFNTRQDSHSPVVDVIKLFLRISRFPKNYQIEKSLFSCLNLHKNVKTILCYSKTIFCFYQYWNNKIYIFKSNKNIKSIIWHKMALFSHSVQVHASKPTIFRFLNIWEI